MVMIDDTHQLDRTSWVKTASGHPSFPIHNLPFGIFSPSAHSRTGAPDDDRRAGVAIGDQILDIPAALQAGLFQGLAHEAAEALAPFRRPQPPHPPGDPADQAQGCFEIEFQVSLLTPTMQTAHQPLHRLSVAHAAMLYWTVAQMVAHHTSNGCNFLPGDLLDSGTVSGTEPGSEGCLLEMSRGGQRSIRLPGGETRTYLQDGDEVIFSAFCRKPGYPTIGFGECRGVIAPAV